MTDATQADDTIVPQTPVAGGEQGGAFGGQPYDPNASTSSDGDFVLDMDDIPDFSLDDLGEDIEEETQAPSVDQPTQDAPVSTDSVPDVTPATSDISLDLDNLGDSIKQSAEQTAVSVDVSENPSPDSPESVSVGDFDLNLGSLEEPATNADMSASSVADVATDTIATPATTPDLNLNMDSVEDPSTSQQTENVTDDISFDLGDITEQVAPETSVAPEISAESVDSITDDSFDLNLDTVEEKAPSTESEIPATSEVSIDVDLNLDSVEEELTPVASTTNQSPAPEAEIPVTDDVDLGDIAPVVEEESTVEHVSTDSASVSDVASAVAPAVVAVARVDVPEDISPLGDKVVSLMNRTLEAQSLLDEPVRVLGASHDREQVHYEFAMDDDQMLTVVRDAVDGGDTVTKTHLTLSFVGSSLVVRLDDVVVFDEAHDEDIYQKYAHTISEKMGKFGMYVDDYVADAQEKVATKAATQQIKQAGKQLQAF